MMSKLTKSIIGPTHQQCYSGYRQRTRNNKYSLRTEQRKYWKTHRWINGNPSKVSKTLPTSEPEECPSKASRSPYGSTNGPACLQADEEKWRKPWCQLNEPEPEQVMSTVATETKLDRIFDWRQYSSFNRIKNFIVYFMRFKTKQKGPLKADEIHQAEQILFRFVQNESFPNVSKSIANSKEISKTLNIVKLSPFIEEDRTIRVKGRLKHSNLDYNAKHIILLTAKHPVVQILLEKAHQDNLYEGTEYVRNMLQQEYWIIGLRNALRKIKLSCIKCRHRNANPIHPPMADLPRERLDEHVFPFTHTGVDYFEPFEVKFLRPTYLEEMVLPLHLPDNESSTH